MVNQHQKMRKRFVVAAKDAFEEIAKLYAAGTTDLDALCLWSSRRMQAVVDTEGKEKTTRRIPRPPRQNKNGV